MRILVLGVYYATNLGDAVICDCTAARLRSAFPQAEVVVRDVKNRTCFPPPRTISLDRMEAQRKRDHLRHLATRVGWDKEKIHEEYRLRDSIDYIQSLCAEPWDAVVFAGGQLFQDGFSLFLNEFVLRLEARSIPVFFNACGTGPSWSPYVQKKLKEALCASNVALISTRDNASLIERVYLKDSGKDVIPVTDPALWAADVYNIRPAKSPVIGLGVMYATSLNIVKETRFWCRLIRFLEEKHVPWELFVNGAPEDITYAKHILQQLSDLPDIKDRLAPAPKTPEELVLTVAGYRAIVSFRLHSHITACSLGIPGIAIVWDEKLQFFYEKLGHPERCHSVMDSPDVIWNALQTAMDEGVPMKQIKSDRADSDKVLLQAIQRTVGKGENYEHNTAD